MALDQLGALGFFEFHSPWGSRTGSMEGCGLGAGEFVGVWGRQFHSPWDCLGLASCSQQNGERSSGHVVRRDFNTPN